MLDSKFLLFYGWTFLIPWGVVHYLLKYVLDRKITGARHQMPRPEIVNHTRTFGALFVAILIWFAIYILHTNEFNQISLFFFCALFGAAILLFSSLIGLWQLKRWGVVLIGIVIGIFMLGFIRAYLLDTVNSLCPSLTFILGVLFLQELWKTVNNKNNRWPRL